MMDFQSVDLNLVYILFFDNLVIESTKRVQHDYEYYFVAKLLRANGGCLGVKRR